MSESFSPAPPSGAISRHGWLKAAYALLFAALLPLLLAAWARALDRNVPFPTLDSDPSGWALAALGAALIAGAVFGLRLRGRGWPMSPFPPTRLVMTGVYGLVSHPIYLGSVLLAFGVSAAYGSEGGLWIVSPVLALACLAFVAGYEHEQTVARFGPRPSPPALRLPAATEEPPSIADRLSVYFLVFLPWYLLVEGLNALGTSVHAREAYMRWERSLPVVGWTEVFYFLGYVLVLLAPLAARSRGELRRFVLRGWVAITVVVSIYVTLPVSCAAKPVPEESAFATMLHWERMFEEPNSAFPSFHVIWAMLAMQALLERRPSLRTPGWILVGAIATSCVTTGMHAIADVVAALGLGLLLMHAEKLWAWVLGVCERIAGSWRETTLGGIRLINHGVWAALGGLVGLVIVFALHGGEAGSVVIVAVASIVAAGLWAQGLEGSSALSRPFGFYGGLLGGLAAIAVMGIAGHDWLRLLAAYSVGLPFAQALGRLRCLVQGCCHGRPTTTELGMRYVHARSRVVRLAGLGGVPVHATQLYSILGNVLIGSLLVRAWQEALPLALIAGFYFILSGLQRFVEEHFRGEPQTRIVGGLRLYQWLAIASVVAGAWLQTLDSVVAPRITPPSPIAIGVSLLVALFAYAAYGIDFPRSNRRFSRLA